ncbi:MAG: DUF1015 family protein [Desulfuromonadaceae bacterium]|nr:DUF1015 family protein [Geobacteraceae bacterium]
MSEIISFGHCSCRNADAESGTENKAQRRLGVDIYGVDTERDASSDCALLLYEIRFARDSKFKIHRGIVAAVHLEQFSSGKILPLELPDSGQIEEHLHNLEVNKIQSGAISALYADPCCVLESLGENEKQRPADVEIFPEEGIRCRVWKVGNHTMLKKVQAVLDKKSLILVHGRSLYEGMLRYRDACREANKEYTGRESFNYAAIALSNIDDFNTEYGMTIEPVISTCSLPEFRDLPLLLGKLGEFFNVNGEELEPVCESVSMHVQRALKDPENPADLVLYPGGKHIYTLQLRSRKHLQETEFDEKQLRADSSAMLYQRLILNHILEVSPEDLHNSEVFYVPGHMLNACEQASETEDCVAFFAPGPSISQVRDIAWDDIQVPGGLIRCNPLFPSGVVNFSVRD